VPLNDILPKNAVIFRATFFEFKLGTHAQQKDCREVFMDCSALTPLSFFVFLVVFLDFNQFHQISGNDFDSRSAAEEKG
jgi:hypothetical protein